MTDNNITDVFIPVGEDGYYSLSEFEDQCENENFTIFHQNIRSFNQNFDSLSVFLDSVSKPIDILVLTETWFSDTFQCDIEGYRSFHTHRTGKRGGRVSVYVRGGIRAHLVEEKCTIVDFIETCVVEICYGNGIASTKMIIYGLYKPPGTPSVNFVEFLDAVNCEISNILMVILGDFNIDLLEEEANNDLVNMMFSHNFYPLINVPTRVAASSAKCIDHIWYNRFNASHSGCFITDFSHHYLVFSVLNTVSSPTLMRKTIRNQSERNVINLLTSLSSLMTEYFRDNCNKNVNEKSKYFLDKLNRLYDMYCPKIVKTISRKKYSRPWITDDLITMINYKHTLFKRYKQSIVTFDIYNEYKNELKRHLKRRKTEFFQK